MAVKKLDKTLTYWSKDRHLLKHEVAKGLATVKGSAEIDYDTHES